MRVAEPLCTQILARSTTLPPRFCWPMQGYEMNSVCVPRKAKDAVGAITKLVKPDGSSITVNVEYNQLEPMLKCVEPCVEALVGAWKLCLLLHCLSKCREKMYSSLLVNVGDAMLGLRGTLFASEFGNTRLARLRSLRSAEPLASQRVTLMAPTATPRSPATSTSSSLPCHSTPQCLIARVASCPSS